MKTIKIIPPGPIDPGVTIKGCGGKRKGCGSTWAGATKLETKIKVAA